MGCKDDALGQLLYPCLVVAQDIQCVGIYDNGTRGALDLPDESYCRAFIVSQSGADTERIKLVALYTFREISFLVVFVASTDAPAMP